MSKFQQWPDYVYRGSAYGAASWSAYAVVEFVFSSVLFRLTRPYATFTAWHWKLTAEVMLGYLIVGPLLGALAGFVVWLMRENETVRTSPARVLEIAASLTVSLAFVINLVLIPEGQAQYGSTRLWLAALAFVVILALCMRSRWWMDRAGLLTNSWVISGLLLGLGQYFGLSDMLAAAQLGVRIGSWTVLLGCALALTVVLAVWIGWRGRLAAKPWITGGSIAACVVLALVSLALSLRVTAEVHAASPAIAPGTRPNIVLIVMDTVRADHLSVLGYGRDTTPNLKRLAQDSVVYAHTTAASDITITSHASLFTGMYPSWHGAYCQPPEATYGRELAKEYPTLAELLLKSGYETIGVAANLYLRADFGLERGFEQFRIPRPVPMLPDGKSYFLRGVLRRGLSYGVDTAQFDRLYSMGEDIDATLFSTLDYRSRPDAPLFVFMNYMDAHYPYVPPAPYSSAFPGRRARVTQQDLDAEQNRISRGQGVPADYQPHCESQYDGGIAYMDAQVGKVVEWLKRANAYDNTMVIVASDHGESFGERRRVGHANSPYQNLLHVPLLVKYPRSAHRGTEERASSLIDVAPTILTAAEIAVPATMQGRNLADNSTPRTIYGETFPCPVLVPPECPGGCSAKAVISWPMKYVALSNGKRQLFDLSADPDEQRNLYVEQWDRSMQIDAALTAWTKNLPAQARQTKRVDAEKLKQLQGLGYIQ